MDFHNEKLSLLRPKLLSKSNYNNNNNNNNNNNIIRATCSHYESKKMTMHRNKTDCRSKKNTFSAKVTEGHKEDGAVGHDILDKQ